MREVQELLAASANELFSRHCTTEVISTGYSEELWTTVDRSGLVDGAELPEAAQVIRVAAQYAAPIPLAETWLAGRFLADAGHPLPAGPLTVGRFDGGRAIGVPYARVARRIVAMVGDQIGLVDPAGARFNPGQNLAGEPRDEVVAEIVDLRPCGSPFGVEGGYALLRSIQLAGALERVLQLSISHTREREQFGQPLNRFQAVAHQLAELAGEAATARAAADAAVAQTDSWRIAAAKVRCGEAAGRAATIAHQLHGAIGFTEEHVLHHFTLRLWSWRDEFGTESEWASVLGGLVQDRLWETLTE